MPRLRSGDRLVDWLFAQVVKILNRTGTEIYRVKSLNDRRGKKRINLDGLLVPGASPYENEAFINVKRRHNKTKDGKARTLLHEILHILMPQGLERDILRLETILYRRFHQEQRNLLKTYLPKRIQKRS